MTEEETVASVEARYKAAMLKQAELMEASIAAAEKAKEAEDAKAQADQLEADKIAAKEELFTELDARYGKQSTADEINDPNAGKNTQGKPKGDWATFHDKWMKAKGFTYSPYADLAFTNNDMGFAFTDSDTGCEDDVSEWSPADVYCDLIWQAVNCGRQLSGIVTMRACDINAGNGLTVQIKTINASSMGSALAACECSSCASNVFGTYSLTLARYDVYKVLCELDVFDVGDSLKAAIIESMSEAFIVGIDALIWTAISATGVGFTETSDTSFLCDPNEPTTTCCRYGANLYKEIIQLEARMRAAGYGKDGFYAIMHPTIALYLKYKEGTNPPPWVNNIVMDGNKLTKIGDIKVIEYCGASACTAVGGEGGSDYANSVVAVLLDPKRAVGEAYGKRPHLLTDKDPIECDSTKLIMRTYIAISRLEVNAIGHVIQPA